jgi:hypothetical protein
MAENSLSGKGFPEYYAAHVIRFSAARLANVKNKKSSDVSVRRLWARK